MALFDELRAALEPFKAEAIELPAAWADDEPYWLDNPDFEGVSSEFTVGDVRAAARLHERLSSELPGDVGELVKRLRPLAERATPGPWKIYDGCSWRRIGVADTRQDRYDTAVLAPYNASDGHPDLHSSDANTQANLTFIAACDPQTIGGLLDLIESLVRERDDQYDENVNRIAAEGAAILRAETAEAKLAKAQEALNDVHGMAACFADVHHFAEDITNRARSTLKDINP